MLFINAALSKNQLYKRKNQANKVLTIIKQDDIMVGFWFTDTRGFGKE